jgi:hypothetical protein
MMMVVAFVDVVGYVSLGPGANEMKTRGGEREGRRRKRKMKERGGGACGKFRATSFSWMGVFFFLLSILG